MLPFCLGKCVLICIDKPEKIHYVEGKIYDVG